MPKPASKKGLSASQPLRLSAYIDVALFMATLFLANWFWKWMIHGDEAGVGAVTCFGLDVTALFDAYARHITAVVYAVVHSFRDTLYMVNDVTMRFVDGGGTHIVWSCTPLKQMFIWVCLMLTTPTSFSAAVFQRSDLSAFQPLSPSAFLPFRLSAFQPLSPSAFLPVGRSFSAAVISKLWFIPLGLFLIHVVNLARICAITAFMEFHPDWFELLHTYIFKYLFYGLMFLFWVLYVEKVRK